jgi:hypothetical protein
MGINHEGYYPMKVLGVHLTGVAENMETGFIIF